MGKQSKISSINNISNGKIIEIKRILDLEKKYQKILWEIFTSPDFIQDLTHIEDYIKSNYESIKETWELKNILKTGAERVAWHHMYFDLQLHNSHVKDIYPSPISGDIGLILDDIVLSLDVKTIDTVGNRTDIGNVQFLPNQSSIVNINLDSDSTLVNSGVKVESLLPTYFNHENTNKPVLTFFLMIIYTDNKRSFSLNRNSRYGTLSLACLPNGETCVLYNFELVDNFKTYKYLKGADFTPRLILRNCNKNEANNGVRLYQSEHTELKLISGRTKVGLFDSEKIHPRYKTPGISWFPVSRKVKNSKPATYDFYLNAVKNGDTSRIKKSKLKDRYDSNDEYWEGVKVKTL